MMKMQEGVRPAVAAAGRTAETAAACETTSNSVFHDNIAMEVRQIKIVDFLLAGVENAVPRCHLRQMTGFSDRELRRRIQEERLSGIPILSDNMSGYYLPADEFERRRFVCSMRGRAKEIQAVAAAVEGAAVEKGEVHTE